MMSSKPLYQFEHKLTYHRHLLRLEQISRERPRLSSREGSDSLRRMHGIRSRSSQFRTLEQASVLDVENGKRINSIIQIAGRKSARGDGQCRACAASRPRGGRSKLLPSQGGAPDRPQQHHPRRAHHRQALRLDPAALRRDIAAYEQTKRSLERNKKVSLPHLDAVSRLSSDLPSRRGRGPMFSDLLPSDPSFSSRIPAPSQTGVLDDKKRLESIFYFGSRPCRILLSEGLMENLRRQLQKYNTCCESPEGPSALGPHWQHGPQKYLFDLSELESPVALQMRPVNVDPWFTSQPSSRGPESKPGVIIRRTVQLRPSFSRKSQAKEEEVLAAGKTSNSIIPKLKNLLIRLESPEKTGEVEGENGEPMGCNWLRELKGQKPRGKAGKAAKSQHIRITQHSSQKRARTGVGSFKEGRTEMLFMQTHQEKARDMGEHLSLLKEARRRRTLKNLLF